MLAANLALDELLDFQPDGGILRFAGQRALLLDAVALGLLRKELVELLGFDAARGAMTRFGYAHGWRTAENLEHSLPWTSRDEWRRAGGRLHRLQGMVTFEPVHPSKLSSPPGLAEAIWRDSYEAEQHLLHFGDHEQPVCWSLCGFASGYLSRAHGRPIFCVETQCRGRGDALCRMWGDARDAVVEHGHADALAYFEQQGLDDSLLRVRGILRKLESKLRARRRALDDHDDLVDAEAEAAGLVARSPMMRTLLDLARRVAPVDSTLLITGPTGAGKERVAHFVHDHSARVGGPFIAINCAAMPEQLLESELFGHTKGAFTGATRDRIGLFEAAHTGTLLLDEIGELAPATQTRLLRVLQEREVRRIGENLPRSVDVRILAATHRDLLADVESGRFREDLYYRLRVVELHVPPLRDRPEDILPLSRSLLASAGTRLGRTLDGLAPGACEALLAHTWPGNVRELQNAIEHAVALARGRMVEAKDLPQLERRAARPRASEAQVRASPEPQPDRTLAEVEREHIQSVLSASGNNKTEAARRLGIGTATLFRRLRQYRNLEGIG
ncbi:sigma-54-dependent Fis family transcriptional regulator [Enhygromyxa salina]|uniref:Transcriptional regulatory protein ZraR n=1 Tax=Enhygromyxa salina TaxID=215803 RepID=A0A2S9YFX0_9BACT|nr:sigma-54-dependent Fis family transcriptional regulator [Enhygromyxa salina]PRQ03941.1 Transcriptional regulatory protein ZraR [Enhygromyxa salina]